MQTTESLSISRTGLAKAWRNTLVILMVTCSLILGLYWNTWYSMVGIWWRSDTFQHGFLVLPVSIWLIWQRREYFRHYSPQPVRLAVLAMLMAGFLWLTAELVHAQVIAHFAVVLLLITCIWGVLGNQIVTSILFPLLFLLLMVPFGEAFVPSLMNFTADFTVGMLHLFGFPVYREGLYFTLTSGSWSVAEACSGIRYLIASFALGIIYAYLNYASFYKRVLFVVLSLIVPIFANGLRAFMIVMIGHFSGMQLATGVDHIIYGWLFFGLVILFLFYCGAFYREDQVAPSYESDAAIKWESVSTKSNNTIVLVSLVVGILIWPIFAHTISNQQASQIVWQTPANIGGWSTHEASNWTWQPEFEGVDSDSKLFFQKGLHLVEVYQVSFGKESQGKTELVNSQHKLIPDKYSIWREINLDGLALTNPKEGAWFTAERTLLRSENLDLCLIKWYRIGNWNTANTYHAKLLQLFKRLTGNTDPELMVIMIVEGSHSDDYASAWQALASAAADFKSTLFSD